MKYEILAPFIVALLRSRGRGDRSDIEPYQELQFAYGEAWLQIEDSCDMGRVPDGRCKHVTVPQNDDKCAISD